MEPLLATAAPLERAARRLSLCRLAAFAGAVAAGSLAGSYPLLAWIGVPAGLAAFLALVFRHGRHEDRLARLRERITLATEAGARRRSRRWPGAPPPVDSVDPLEAGLPVYRQEPDAVEIDALTADDLGIHSAGGAGSPSTLYGFLNRTSTVFGARRLRRILGSALRHVRDIRERQAAVKLLAGDAGLRESLLASFLPLRAHNLEPLPGTLRADPVLAGRDSLFLWTSLTGTALPAAMVLALATADWRWVSAIVPLAVANVATIAHQSRRTTPRRDRLLLLAPLLESLRRLEASLAGARIEAPAFTALQAAIAAASAPSARLRRRLGLLAFSQYGAIFELCNLLTLWELRVLPLVESEVLKVREPLERALGAIGDCEALLALALPLAEQPGFEMPEPLEAERPMLDAMELGHPLLDAAAAVRNPVRLGPGGNVLIVTGSNMAGKSTYLKSIGLNVALANAGGPVCATGMRWTPVEIHSDMNVRDSLDDGKSYFQVEVERVRTAISRAAATPHVLAVFDELFRGTNSTERVALARSILRHLRSTGALVVAATHDASLTRLVSEEREPGMINAHFRESVEGTGMRFDYRLREGPAATRNAIRVLEAHGYPVAITEAARRECGES